MPIAPVDEEGTVLFYEDSGAPKGLEDYTTIVLIHGLMFHGGIFRRLIPYAATFRLRLILLNTRDYPGSSRFTKEELEHIRSTEPTLQAAVVQVLGREVAVFLQYLARNAGVPPVSVKAGKRRGGIVLLTWSLGTLVSMSMLSNVASLPYELRDTLGRYLRTVVMYDPSITTVGGDGSQLYSPARDESLSEEEKGQRFCNWVSYYYTPVTDLDEVTVPLLTARKVLREDQDAARYGVDIKPTLQRMTDIQYKSVVDSGVFIRSYVSLRALTVGGTHTRNLRKALFDTGGLCPDVNVLHLWCDMSVSDCVMAAKYVSDLTKAARENSESEGTVYRRYEVVRAPNANHFWHWDDPQALIRLLVSKL